MKYFYIKCDNLLDKHRDQGPDVTIDGDQGDDVTIDGDQGPDIYYGSEDPEDPDSILYGKYDPPRP